MSAQSFQRFDQTPAYRDAASLIDTLVAAGHTAYFAGGCVRDALLNIEPKDYDVATSATPDAVRACFRRVQGVGEAFGVMLVRQPSSQVEIATFRSDGNYADGRRPDQVTFASAEEDARRRDFTINGMFYDPRAGRVLDFIGGQADLAARVVRAIGDADARFAEDYLRMLRAVRFAARLDFAIEATTRVAIGWHATKLMRIAPERIADELRRMFSAPSAVRAVGLLDQLGMSDVLFRRVDAQFARVESQPLETTAMLRAIGQPLSFSFVLAASAVARALAGGSDVAGVVNVDAVRRIDVALRETLRYSNDESAAVRGTLALHTLFDTTRPPRVATLKRFLATPHADDALRLLRVLADATGRPDRAASIDRLIASFAGEDVAPPPLVTGDDLKSMGFAPSPRFKRVLDATYDEQLERRLTSREAAMEFARRQMASS